MTAIVDHEMTLLGIFTDGDLRRLLDQRIDVHTTSISEVMTKNPTVASPHLLAVEGLNIMQDKSINGLMLCQDGKLVGALNMHDLLKIWSNVMTQMTSTPYGQAPTAIMDIAKNIKLLICDVDGVFSDGLVYMGNQGKSLKLSIRVMVMALKP